MQKVRHLKSLQKDNIGTKFGDYRITITSLCNTVEELQEKVEALEKKETVKVLSESVDRKITNHDFNTIYNALKKYAESFNTDDIDKIMLKITHACTDCSH